MTYKLKPTDKIEVEVEDLRLMVRRLREEGLEVFPNEIVSKYRAAFAPEEPEWEDVTDQCHVIQYFLDMLGTEEFSLARPNKNYKIENDRIWRRK